MIFESSAVDGKRFLESKASSIRGTYLRLGYGFLESSNRGTFHRQLHLFLIFNYSSFVRAKTDVPLSCLDSQVVDIPHCYFTR